MKKNIDNKGFTLVELLAVIVVLAIVMGIAAVSITNVLDTTRKNAFVASAKQYIAGAKTLVNADEASVMLGGTAKYAPKCDSGTGNHTTYISIGDIRTEGGTNDKSPYGNAFVKTATTGTTQPTAGSYVQVSGSTDANGNCTYVYSIFLTDGTYAIEDADKNTKGFPVLESKLEASKVATARS